MKRHTARTTGKIEDVSEDFLEGEVANLDVGFLIDRVMCEDDENDALLDSYQKFANERK